MRKLRLRKSMKAAWITAAMTLAGSSLAFGAAQALPNGTIVNVGGVNYLTDPQGERYSGWFIDAGENWYYFNESDKAMKTGWHHDSEDGYWYYLNPADGKMADGWQTIDGKEYFFQPVRNMGDYFFKSEQEKWLYSLNSNVPYGAMYRSTVTPDGSMVDETGAKVTGSSQTAAVQNGWVTQNGKKYYFENGIMVSGGWKTIGGKSYYFGGDGTLYVNTTTPDGRYVGNDGVEINGEILAGYPVNWDSFTGTFCSESEYRLIMENAPLVGGVERAANKILSARGYEYMSIHRIEGNRIYGELHIHGGFDDWSSSFQGVEISDTGNFQIMVNYEEQGNSIEVVEGVRDSYSDQFIADCMLTEKDGYLFVKVNGKSKVPYGALEQLTLVKVMDKVIRD